MVFGTHSQPKWFISLPFCFPSQFVSSLTILHRRCRYNVSRGLSEIPIRTINLAIPSELTLVPLDYQFRSCTALLSGDHKTSKWRVFLALASSSVPGIHCKLHLPCYYQQPRLVQTSEMLK